VRGSLVLLAAVTLAAQTPSAPADLLARVRARLAPALDHLPDYTCVQTLDRRHFERTVAWRSCQGLDANQDPSKLVLVTSDRLRLDVAVTTSGREIYSWAVAREFGSERLQDLVGTGALGTGSLGPFLSGIFANRGAEFSDQGDEEVDGSLLRKFTYRVPRAASHYEFKSADGTSVIAYDGAFWVEPRTAELVRLEVHSASLPHETGTCEATTTVDFHRGAIGAGVYLLPRASRLEFSALTGHYANDIAYAACREYHSESVIHFGEPDAGAPSGPAGRTKPLEPLPRGLPLILAFETAIDTRTAAAGDEVRARVVKAVVEKKTNRVLAPARRAIGRRDAGFPRHGAGLRRAARFRIAVAHCGRELTARDCAAPYSTGTGRSNTTSTVEPPCRSTSRPRVRRTVARPTAPPAPAPIPAPFQLRSVSPPMAAPAPPIVAIFSASVPLLPPCWIWRSLVSTFWSVPSESTELSCGEIFTTLPLGSVRLSMRIPSSARPFTRPLRTECDTTP